MDRRHFPILDHGRVVKALGFVPPLGAYDSFLPFRAFGNCMGGVDSDRSHHFTTEEVDKDVWKLYRNHKWLRWLDIDNLCDLTGSQSSTFPRAAQIIVF